MLNLRWVNNSMNQLNTPTRNSNVLGERCIQKQRDYYVVRIRRYKHYYSKYCKTLEEAIIQRNLMLSMFN